MRFHLFPFRTEKLSSLTPMVLRFSRGRVGSRLFKVRSKGLTFFCVHSRVQGSVGQRSGAACGLSVPDLREAAGAPLRGKVRLSCARHRAAFRGCCFVLRFSEGAAYVRRAVVRLRCGRIAVRTLCGRADYLPLYFVRRRTTARSEGRCSCFVL